MQRWNGREEKHEWRAWARNPDNQSRIKMKKGISRKMPQSMIVQRNLLLKQSLRCFAYKTCRESEPDCKFFPVILLRQFSYEEEVDEPPDSTTSAGDQFSYSGSCLSEHETVYTQTAKKDRNEKHCHRRFKCDHRKRCPFIFIHF